MPTGSERLVHILLDPGYAETQTLCGMHVPAVWDDIGLETEEIVDSSTDMGEVTCLSCLGQLEKAESGGVEPPEVRWPGQ